MKAWRYALVFGLLLLPLAVLFGVGQVALWRNGQLLWLWWLLPVCWGAAYGLTRLWRSRLTPAADWSRPPPAQWTPQDEEAWHLVAQHQERVREIPPQRLTEAQCYLQSAQELAAALAQHYHPHAQDPIGGVTVPEILAAAQLALEDTAQWVEDYVPGSHLASVDQWRLLAKAPGWLKTFSELSWLASIVWNPTNLARYVVAKLTMQSATRPLQENAWAWLYVVFIRHIGFYLIEMNSGRLRGGAARYRDLRARLAGGPHASSAETAAPDKCAVTVALVGQVNAGKSSLINALLGQSQAAVDVLPETKHVTRYRLGIADAGAELTLLDTAGYGDDGETKQSHRETHTALAQADLVLLVLDATQPARRADLQTLREMLAPFRATTGRKPPPALGVLTHIDNLRPAMEWKPPYDIARPNGTKAENIAAAAAYNRQLLGDLVDGVIPVCTDLPRGKCYGVQEHLLPAIVGLLDEARACALLRTLHHELDSNQIRRLFQQLANAGGVLLKACATGEVPMLTRAMPDALP